MNDNPPIPNVALRDHVSDHSFVLTLRKTHITFLIALAHGERSTLGDWVTPSRGLQSRGLIVHRHAPNFIGKHFGSTTEPITNYYRLTRAGWAVFDLLVEAGLAVEIDRKSSKRKLVA
jgi:hypothetical protein